MCGGLAAPILAAMSETHIAIGLDLDESGDVLAGRITRPDGEVTEFSGWIGLLAAIDALVHDNRSEGAAQ
jgi:hypothetical protein